MTHGLVIGKFYPPHAGHVALIRAALAACERVAVQVLVSSAESLPGDRRAAWLREEVPGAHIVVGLDDHPVDYASDAAWDAHVDVMTALLDEAVDVVFTSDSYGAELATRLGARWHQVDPGRSATPVSGRAIRADPGANWWALGAAARAWFARRVVLVGAESTGTTTLAQDLVAHYGVPEVAEFGRTWRFGREVFRHPGTRLSLTSSRPNSAGSRMTRRDSRPFRSSSRIPMPSPPHYGMSAI